MNKKVLILISALVIALMMASCSKAKEEPVAPDESSASQTTLLPTESTIVETIEYILPEGEGVEVDEEENTQATMESAAAPTVKNNNTTKETTPKATTPTATVPKATEPTVPESTTPTVTEPKSTESTAPETTEPSVSVDYCCEYAEYMAMSPQDQEAKMRSFSDTMAFIAWNQNAAAEHEEHTDTIEIEGGSLNVADYINKLGK